MKIKILIGFLTLSTLLFAGCDSLMMHIFTDANAIEGCVWSLLVEKPDDSEYPKLYDIPDGKVVGELSEYYDSNSDEWYSMFYTFSPVEYTRLLSGFWLKVWVTPGEITILDSAAFQSGARYVWILTFGPAAPTNLEGCEGLPLTEGIEEINCTLRLVEDADVPARVGPGLNRAIRRYLNRQTAETVHVDGRARVDEQNWYRITYNDEKLWIIVSDFEAGAFVDCDLPFVGIPPLTASVTSVQNFEVYNCVHLGGNQFEWYTARVTYNEDGTPAGEEITGGPFKGEWRPGCPAGEVQIVQEPPPPVSNAAPVYKPPPYVPPPCTECDD